TAAPGSDLRKRRRTSSQHAALSAATNASQKRSRPQSEPSSLATERSSNDRVRINPTPAEQDSTLLSPTTSFSHGLARAVGRTVASVRRGGGFYYFVCCKDTWEPDDDMQGIVDTATEVYNAARSRNQRSGKGGPRMFYK
ncbi:hypothetical protein LTR22_028439, partial [Elasticomyces elasticus]